MHLLDDIGVFEALEKADFTNGGRWDPIIFLLESDFL